MGALEQKLINVLESDIRTWESIAAYFDKTGGNLEFADGSKVAAHEKANQLRERTKEWQNLITELKKYK
jgi:hypothetical protein